MITQVSQGELNLDLDPGSVGFDSDPVSIRRLRVLRIEAGLVQIPTDPGSSLFFSQPVY